MKTRAYLGKYLHWLSAIAVTSLGLVILARLPFVRFGRHVFLRDQISKFLSAVGEAGLVAFFLGLVVEPFVRSRVANQLANELLWGLFNPDAPERFRTGFEKLARIQQFLTYSKWTLTFAWIEQSEEAPKYLQVRLNVVAEGSNLAKDWQPVSGDRWAMSSVLNDPKTTYEFLRYSVKDRIVDWSAEDLKGSVRYQTDGTCILSQDDLATRDARLKGQPFIISQEECFSIERTTMMTRGQDDHIPLVRALAVLNEEVVIEGPPIANNELAFFLYFGATTKEFERRGNRLYATLDDPTFPGQAVVVSWKPRTALDDQAEAPDRVP